MVPDTAYAMRTPSGDHVGLFAVMPGATPRIEPSALITFSPPAPDDAVSTVMAEDIVTASPTTKVREAANLLRGHAVGCLPIT